jgi:CHAT domain-containing protein/Tfp pilus assembly protein PilF
MLQKEKRALLAGILLVASLECSARLDPVELPVPQLVTPPSVVAMSTRASQFPHQTFELLSNIGKSHYLQMGKVDAYLVTLRAGQHLQSVVQQEGIDVRLELFAPNGKSLLIVDSHNSDSGPEPVLLVAKQSGIYRMFVSADSSPRAGGYYVIKSINIGSATNWDRPRAAALKHYYETRILHYPLKLDKRSLSQAENALLRSVGEARKSGYRQLELEVLEDLGSCQASEHNWPAAADAYRRAALLAHQLGRREEASLVHHIAENERSARMLDLALANFRRSQVLAHDLGDQEVEAGALANIGMILIDRGDDFEAARSFQAALLLRPTTNAANLKARSLLGLGLVDVEMGRIGEALSFFQQALAVPAIGQSEKAIILSQIGNFYVVKRQPDRALPYLEQAIHIQRDEIKDQKNGATTLVVFGLAYARLNKFEDALNSYGKALNAYRYLNEVSDVGITEMNMGWVLAAMSRYDEATESFGKALDLARELKNPGLEAATLLGSAWMERRRDHLRAAQRLGEEAVNRIEDLRERALDSELRRSFFASKQYAYDLLISTLMDLYERKGSRVALEQAFQMSERARARSLLDTVGSGTLAAVGRTIPPLSTQQIQRQVLDPNTVLLEYWLGKSRAYLWMVSQGRLEGFVLSETSVLTRLAKDVTGELADSRKVKKRGVASENLRSLSRELLGPIAGRLEDRRLLIVTTGPLQLVSFDSLLDAAHSVEPVMGEGFEPAPLFMNHEIIYEPSASVLALARKRSLQRRPAKGMLAALADPVFERDDERLPKAYRSKEYAADPILGRLERLPASRMEAESATAGLDPRLVVKRFDFKANRKAVITGGVKDYRVLHIASHSVAPTDHPELSAIVLSQVDEKGRLQNGRLGIKDISSLDLRADLVVLSACSSALGEEVPGEGIVGLPHAFLSAGASRVVVSLWPVDDTITSELMESFYREMFSKGASPSAALRRARLEMWKTHKSPWYWAGFIIEGDWKGFAVSPNKSSVGVSSPTGASGKSGMMSKSPPLLPPRRWMRRELGAAPSGGDR